MTGGRNTGYGLLLMLLSACVSMHAQAGELASPDGDWAIAVDAKGSWRRLEMTFGQERSQVLLRGQAGFENVEMAKAPGDALAFSGEHEGLLYSLSYRDEAGILTLNAGLHHPASSTNVTVPSGRIRLHLGIDHLMYDPKRYFEVFFPTLLRCEKTHFWGYFQAPDGRIIVLASPDPVASWGLAYVRNQARITTSWLDLIHQGPLPERHPHDLSFPAPGETRTWRIRFQSVDSLDKVMPAAAALSEAPMIALDRTTLAPGESLRGVVYTGGINEPRVSAVDAAGEKLSVPLTKGAGDSMTFELVAPATVGPLSIRVDASGKRTEALVQVRKPWGWYLQQARSEALRMQQKPGTHREMWLGFFSAYWAHVSFPDEGALKETERKFETLFAQMVDPATGSFYEKKPTWHERPQNSAWMLGLLVARYAATGKIGHLQAASDWADRFIEKFQKPSGAFVGYTALTLGGKFLQELAGYEEALAAQDEAWRAPLARHREAVNRAAVHLMEERDLGLTEGQSTYEDNQAGSAWSLLAMHALSATNPQERARFLAASLDVQRRHEALTQAVIPDARMRGGTLRWWEAQYDVLTTPSMMNSPHGWTMRSQFGALYLYLLTGEERFLNIAFNAMGTCAQAIDETTGELRWAFVRDPYMEALRFVSDPERPGQGMRTPAVIGEQWLPMISDWWHVPEGDLASVRKHLTSGLHDVSQGWSCDNDVHEHFRVLAEQFVPNAFVLERADGTWAAWNCRVRQQDGKLLVTPAETVVSRVHVNLRRPWTLEVEFAGGTVREAVEPGMQWVGPGGIPELFR